MIWLSVNRDFFISVDPFLWKKFYFSALRNFGGITQLRMIVKKVLRTFSRQLSITKLMHVLRTLALDGKTDSDTRLA
jgi:hypothetical protein